MRLLLLISVFIISLSSKGQTFISQKLNHCTLSEFCLGCGDIKAKFDSVSMIQVQDYLNKKYKFKSAEGKLYFSVVVDSSGNGCVVDCTDTSYHNVVSDMIDHLNSCKWIAAIENKQRINTGISFYFEFVNLKLVGKMDDDPLEEKVIKQ
jgi:hypothetical protein